MRAFNRSLLNRALLTVGLTLFAATGTIAWWSARARAAAIPGSNALHYVGTLAEKGVPVDGPRAITVVLWNDSATTEEKDRLCVTETEATPVTAGRFEVLLENGCTSAVRDSAESWAEVQVGGISFGRQKIGAVPYAVAASKVDGLVKSDAVLPNYVQDGALGRGAGEASIYNDANGKNALVITGNNSLGQGHKISLLDDVRVGRNLDVVGGATFGGNVQFVGPAKIGLGIYINEIHGTDYEVFCRYDAERQDWDRAISGGVVCGDYETFATVDAPRFWNPAGNGNYGQNSPAIGWRGVCNNHDNLSPMKPVHLYAVCLSHAF